MKKSSLVGCLWMGMLLAAASARAANVQRVQETEQKSADFVFRQYNLAVLSHYSYLIGSGGDRRTGGGPARRRYQQAVQEIIVRSRPACEVAC
jgi:hypothetical protein